MIARQRLRVVVKKEMKMSEDISAFNGVYRFLSNFHYGGRIMLDGARYPTVEHAYQAAKVDPTRQDLRAEIASAVAPGRAKRIGQRVPLRSDWEGIKIGIMLDLLRQKFRPGSLLSKQLLETGDRKLIEGNTWGDTFWGVCYGVGENHLGRLLMQVREELRA